MTIQYEKELKTNQPDPMTENQNLLEFHSTLSY